MEKELEPRRAARRRRQGGFTLIEMLAVVVILAIVAGVGFVVVNNQIEKARVNTDIANLRTIGDAVNRYIMDNGSAPSSMADLVGKYLGSEPKDPWANSSYTLNVTQPNNNTPGNVTVQSPHTYTSQPPNTSTSGSTGLIYSDGTLKLVVNF
ncbi:MAG TPA: prepilin-type N-terminal cleavage/methylation domain-containing protein [Alicyclobacillus sp.]|nr:prepilin-type N-terminal cleavage/methylation domain-containing protein [Alicyclobacillus sp.]